VDQLIADTMRMCPLHFKEDMCLRNTAQTSSVKAGGGATSESGAHSYSRHGGIGGVIRVGGLMLVAMTQLALLLCWGLGTGSLRAIRAS